MINPVTGGYSTEAEIRAHLGAQRRLWMQYRDLDRETGGSWRLAEDIAQLERVLGGQPMTIPDAEHQFLKRNDQVRWNQGGAPTWDHWELVGEQWQITTYEINVQLTPVVVRSSPANNL